MITEKQLELFEIFARHPFASYMRRDIMAYSRQKSNNALSLFIKLLKKENVLSECHIGRAGLLSLNMDNDRTHHYIALCNSRMIPEDAGRSLEILQKEILEINPFYSIVVFGSYAKREQKAKSDLDIAVFIEDDILKKKIEAAANSAKIKSIIELDIHVMPRKEMIDMLTEKEENLGKQIARSHIAVHNHRIFYDIIREGIVRGFRA